MQVSAPLMFRLWSGQLHLLSDGLHRSARTFGREANVVSINLRSAAVEPLVACVTHEPQAHVRLAADISHRTMQGLRVPSRNNGPAVLKLQSGDGAPGRVVHFRHDLGTLLIWAELRLIGQL